jgi:hypothetical protein
MFLVGEVGNNGSKNPHTQKRRVGHPEPRSQNPKTENRNPKTGPRKSELETRNSESFNALGSYDLSKTKIAGFDRGQVQAPLVIGVTGHRDLRPEDRAKLEEKVKEIFLQLRKDYPETPLILVSALAEGADRLAARMALAPHVGVSLIAPLPMPQDLYERDFESLSILETPIGALAVESSSLAEFRGLLERAFASFELGLVHGNTRETIVEPGAKRDRQYELVGKFIAQNSQILIALWDGVESKRVGGTASVVRFQIAGVADTDPCVLEDPEGFPVYHVLTPRVKNPYPQGEAFHCRAIYSEAFAGNEERAKKYYAKMFGRLNEYNEYVARADEDLAEEIEQSKKYLLQDVGESELPGGMVATLNRYAVTDALAVRFRRRWLWAQVLLHSGTFLAFFCFVLFVHGEGHRLRFLIAAWIMLGVTLLGAYLFRQWELDTQHVDYRAIAEGLRVRFFWKLAGIKDSVADHYLGKQRSELDWIRNGFRGWRMEEEGGQAKDSAGQSEGSRDEQSASDRLGFVRKYWIDHQREYFSQTANRSLKKSEDIELAGYICFVAVIVLGARFFWPDMREEKYLGPVAIALEGFLALTAILHHFNNRMAYEEYSKQYERMATLFARGSELLGNFLERGDIENAARCVKLVGSEALTENGDWVLLRRERPLEVPHP